MWPVDRWRNVVLARRNEFMKGILPIDRHRSAAQFVGRGMQRDCQVHLQGFLAEFSYSWNKSHGRDGHMASPQVEALGAVEDAQRLQHIAIVMQRFAHAHQNDVGNVTDGWAAWESCSSPRGGPQFTRKEEDLVDNFTRAEVTVKAHLSRGAKSTAIGAACL